MIRYFLIFFVGVAALIVGIFGFRGDKFRDTPVRLFPDMDEQDKLKSQKPNQFFKDGNGSRLPVAGTLPHASDDGIYSLEFGAGRSGYYYTGRFGDYFGKGLPNKVNFSEKNADAFLARGQERYGIYCAVCHGESGDGAGVTSQYGIAGIANLHAPNFKSSEYPEGRLYDVITNGKGNMGAYGYNIPVDDRWAIVAYVRALQNAKSIELTDITAN